MRNTEESDFSVIKGSCRDCSAAAESCDQADGETRARPASRRGTEGCVRTLPSS